MAQIPDPSTVEKQPAAAADGTAVCTAAVPSVSSSVGIGAGSGSAFRNVSYQRATHESVLGDNGSSPASRRTAAAAAAASAARAQSSTNSVSDGIGNSDMREPQSIGIGAATMDNEETKVVGRGALASTVSNKTNRKFFANLERF
jgi:hypothetical protein